MANFYEEVIKNDPRFNSTECINDINLLEPVTRALVQQIIAAAAAQGLALMVFETFRSQARQQQLFDQGVTQLRTVGVHNYGLACDIVKNVGGEPSWDGSFAVLGQLAHSHQLIWGGDWGHPEVPHSFYDWDHVQRCTVAMQSRLFAGAWYPADDYNPYV
ncbi:M15 family metallopeptidase [uncultured Mucilaginibacter sp.]|uniref:M15 family metallopeptidase n=1 Tax=uncultured Mucilaginibacter sp. TaxID=797541 RepID=UPI0025EC6A70|nr:M15 family metallopeptidase [uncultured Mucilaginibacter sp.]